MVRRLFAGERWIRTFVSAPAGLGVKPARNAQLRHSFERRVCLTLRWRVMDSNLQFRAK